MVERVHGREGERARGREGAWDGGSTGEGEQEGGCVGGRVHGIEGEREGVQYSPP